MGIHVSKRTSVRSVAQVRREYGTIHHDFRHDVDEALNTFVSTLDTSLQAFRLRMPLRFS